MTGDRYRDFDAWNAEREEKPLTFRVKGKTFTLPSRLPAIIPIRAMRLKAEYGADAEVPPEATMDMALSLFGADQMEELLGTGVDIETLAEIVSWAISEYSGTAPGNAPAAPAAPST